MTTSTESESPVGRICDPSHRTAVAVDGMQFRPAGSPYSPLLFGENEDEALVAVEAVEVNP